LAKLFKTKMNNTAAWSFGEFRSSTKNFHGNLLHNGRSCDMSDHNIQHAEYSTVAATHELHRSWPRRHFWKFASTTGRRRKTGQVAQITLFSNIELNARMSVPKFVCWATCAFGFAFVCR